MYKVKPLYESMNITSLPTTMYKVKCYYDDNDAQSSVSSHSQSEDGIDSLAELNKQQTIQLKRLERLQIKLNELCEELSLDNLIVENKLNKKDSSKDSSSSSSSSKSAKSSCSTQQKQEKNLNKTTTEAKLFNDDPIVKEQLKNVTRATTKKNKNNLVEDIVIQVDPEQHMPYSLFILINQLTLSYKCFIQMHLHGSILTDTNNNKANKNKVDVTSLRNLINLFNSLKLNLNEPRNNYDYGFTFIFKKLNTSIGPVLTLNTLSKGRIFGESNILRYLNGLLPDDQKFQSLELNKRILIDEWIDRCNNDFNMDINNKRQFETYLNLLNSSLAKNNYLSPVNGKPSIADYYTWSSLYQHFNETLSSKFGNIIGWFSRLTNSLPMIQLIKRI